MKYFKLSLIHKLYLGGLTALLLFFSLLFVMSVLPSTKQMVFVMMESLLAFEVA